MGDINQFFGWAMSRQGAAFALFVMGFPLGWMIAGYFIRPGRERLP